MSNRMDQDNSGGSCASSITHEHHYLDSVEIISRQQHHHPQHHPRTGCHKPTECNESASIDGKIEKMPCNDDVAEDKHDFVAEDEHDFAAGVAQDKSTNGDPQELAATATLAATAGEDAYNDFVDSPIKERRDKRLSLKISSRQRHRHQHRQQHPTTGCHKSHKPTECNNESTGIDDYGSIEKRPCSNNDVPDDTGAVATDLVMPGNYDVAEDDNNDAAGCESTTNDGDLVAKASREQHVCNESVNAPPDNTPATERHKLNLSVDIPLWLQQNLCLREKLFLFLLGNEPGKRLGYKTRAIAAETRCTVHVQNTDSDEAMAILLRTASTQNAKNRLKQARELICKSLLEIVQGDGSMGRLMYDFAALYPEFQRSKKSSDGNAGGCGSAGNAIVRQWNPFTDSQNWMTIVPLPYVSLNNGDKDEFHGEYLLSSVKDRIWNDMRCRIKVCGDSFDIPTKYCDPYVFVHGNGRRDVGRAVDFLNNTISYHQSDCICDLP